MKIVSFFLISTLVPISTGMHTKKVIYFKIIKNQGIYFAKIYLVHLKIPVFVFNVPSGTPSVYFIFYIK